MKYVVASIVSLLATQAVYAGNYTDNPPRNGTYPSPCLDGSTCNTVNVGTLGGKPQTSLPSAPGASDSAPPPSAPATQPQSTDSD